MEHIHVHNHRVFHIRSSARSQTSFHRRNTNHCYHMGNNKFHLRSFWAKSRRRDFECVPKCNNEEVASAARRMVRRKIECAYEEYAREHVRSGTYANELNAQQGGYHVFSDIYRIVISKSNDMRRLGVRHNLFREELLNK